MTAIRTPHYSEFRADAEALRERALDLLDFPAVRERIAGYTTFPPARELAERMVPSYAIEDVLVLQRETAEARSLIDQGVDLNLPSDEDTLEHVQRADLGGILSGLELLTVSELLNALYRARSSFVRAREQAPLLAEIAEGIPDLRDVSRQIVSAIGPRGDVLDSATPGLGLLRRQVRSAYQRVTQALERILGSSEGRDALQDQVVSVRSERLVLQVKSEMRHRIPGIVHDASNTGATLYIEPFPTVDLCNEWRELALEEDREVLRVLHRLSSMVGDHSHDIVRGTGYTARLDFVTARARYSTAVDGVPFSLEPDHATSERSSTINLIGARHPQLGHDAVPISVTVGPDWSALVITGPNTGGKTVAMKTVGLLAQMHQSGLQIPADEGSWLPIFDGIYADIGDRQSISESVSTFSSHMRNVIDIMSAATPSSLVLMDELGSSTDPEEGAALAKAILDRLVEDGVPTIITTHHRSVAAFAETHPRIMNASVDLDPNTLDPTYRVTVGVAGRSYAMTVAERLGLPEEIMRNAESLLEPQFRRFEDWLNELNQERAQLQVTLDQAEEARSEAESARREYEERSREIESNRQTILDGVRNEISGQYAGVQRKLRGIESVLSWTPPSAMHAQEGHAPVPPTTDDLEKVTRELSEIRQEMERVTARETPPTLAEVEDRPIVAGDVVDIRGLDLWGRVESLFGDSGDAEVVIGNLRLKLDLNRLTLTPNQQAQSVGHDEADPRAEPMELADARDGMPLRDLDLRGHRVEPAIFEVDTFLQSAVSDGLTAVRIIHGHGTGALRTAVRELLRDHSLATSFRPETPERGGNGVTVVDLA